MKRVMIITVLLSLFGLNWAYADEGYCPQTFEYYKNTLTIKMNARASMGQQRDYNLERAVHYFNNTANKRVGLKVTGSQGGYTALYVHFPSTYPDYGRRCMHEVLENKCDRWKISNGTQAVCLNYR